VMKIYLLFYVCHFAIGLTHCYKTTAFFTFISELAKKRSKVKEIIVLIKARSFMDELNLEHLTS